MTSRGSSPAPTIPEIFDHLVAEGQKPALRRTSGVYEFDFDDGGRWFLRLDHGTPWLQDSADDPDVVIDCTAADFIEIAQGKRNLMAAFLEGRIKATGDPAFALDFRRLVPVAA
jgi:putative sterol carrier protein